MTYLQQFEEKINNKDYPGFLKIWEEYCYSDEVNYNEIKKIIIKAKKSGLFTKTSESNIIFKL